MTSENLQPLMCVSQRTSGGHGLSQCPADCGMAWHAALCANKNPNVPPQTATPASHELGQEMANDFWKGPDRKYSGL